MYWHTSLGINDDNSVTKQEIQRPKHQMRCNQRRTWSENSAHSHNGQSSDSIWLRDKHCLGMWCGPMHARRIIVSIQTLDWQFSRGHERARDTFSIAIFFTPRGLMNHYFGQSCPYKAWWCQMSQQINLWTTLPKMILGYPGVVLQTFRPMITKKKLLKHFWDWPFPLKVDAADDDADKSAFEKLRCHLAQRS